MMQACNSHVSVAVFQEASGMDREHSCALCARAQGLLRAHAPSGAKKSSRQTRLQLNCIVSISCGGIQKKKSGAQGSSLQNERKLANSVAETARRFAVQLCKNDPLGSHASRMQSFFQSRQRMTLLVRSFLFPYTRFLNICTLE